MMRIPLGFGAVLLLLFMFAGTANATVSVSISVQKGASGNDCSDVVIILHVAGRDAQYAHGLVYIVMLNGNLLATNNIADFRQDDWKDRVAVALSELPH